MLDIKVMLKTRSRALDGVVNIVNDQVIKLTPKRETESSPAAAYINVNGYPPIK